MAHQPIDDILFLLLDDQDRSYFVDPVSRLVQVSSTMRPLRVPPAGFEGQTVQWIRNLVTNGVITSMTAPFTFKRDGATILRHLYYTKGGVQAYCKLVIQIRDNDNWFRDLYVGMLDFSTSNDNQGASQDEGFVCESVHQGLNELLAANKSTTYEMSVDVPEAIDVTMDGITLFSNVRAIKYADVAYFDGLPTTVTWHRRYVNVGFTLPVTETQYPSILWNDQTIYQDLDDVNEIKNALPNDWLFRATADTPVTINIPHFRFFIASGPWRLGYWAFNEISGVGRFIQLAAGTPSGSTQNYDIPLQDVNLINEGEKVWFVFDLIDPGDGGIVSFSNFPNFDSDEASFEYEYRKEPTIVKWLPPMYVLSELVKRITNGAYEAYSDLLSSEVNNFLMTSGDAIRGISGSVMKISLDNFLKSYNVPFPLSLNTSEGRVRVEREGFAYNSELLPSLGEVMSLRTTPSQEHLYSKFRFGWPNQTYDNVNGRFEFNVTSLYGTVITKMDKEFDCVSYARGDSLGIEFTRVNLENKTTTDSSSDESVFMLDALYTGANTAIINRPAGIVITGIPNADSVFNIRLSPARCARAHGAKVRTALWLNEDSVLEYITKNKNVDIVTVEGGVEIREKADIPVLSLPQKMYLPVRAHVGVKTSQQIRDYINSNPGGQLPFVWYVGNRPVELRGFVMEASQEPVYLAEQEFNLLLAGDVDINKIVY